MTASEVKKRQAIERRIASRIVKDALKAGFSITVCNGGDTPEIKQATKYKEVMATLFAADEDYLVFVDKEGKRVGWVWLIYGNGGYDVIADNTDNEATNALLKPAEELANKLAG